ncbi:spastin-like isoform X2 [Amphibalanus amphitrite]|uniref:spastin-like isoform X2 n=1 Tax=Amphibalanus amphitrite TaxID=1232801 RepID=UPI001C929FBA|nr:spastin-like isoform X2 [Amphibalanus amphitrite]XP_043193699.1 spastin-like isoform X2 [Amphibalanus amphitrite]XP_043193700.1 spastin-like isoform X2 [Amphibalanus amphitrite]XP_043193701.1 spastin-like isoform X2 [Amphibalanus amphitrite]XP_043193702.1 spastin-like isoform X2 [Amphibalanus amphitrite]
MASVSSDCNAGFTDPLLAKQKQHSKRAFELIAKALRLDEENKHGSRPEAVRLYREGIAELERGIAVDCSGRGEDRRRAQRLQTKMQTNLAVAADRLRFLERMACLEERAADSVVPPAARQRPGPTARPPGQAAGRPAARATGQTGDPVTGHGSGQPPAVTVIREGRRKPSTGTEAAERKISPVYGYSGPGRRPAPSTGTSRTTPSSVPARRRPAAPGTAATRSTPNRAGGLSSPATSSSGTPSRSARKLLSTAGLKGVDPKLAQLILDEIIDAGPVVTLDDIAGNASAKRALQELVILPSVRPELFTGLRAPARGLLLFGPPGNGKTMLARALASEASVTFFSISASSLTSKWHGEGEKLVRALFAVARELQPSIIFMDELDSLLSERREGEHDASRRLKTEFLCQFDGLGTNAEDKILVLGATNRPQELDQAILRRFPKRIYIPLPDREARKALLGRLLSSHGQPLRQGDLQTLAELTDGYSASDIAALARDAALGPIREMDQEQVKSIDPKKLRHINVNDFKDSLKRIRRSVDAQTLAQYEKFEREYGELRA